MEFLGSLLFGRATAGDLEMILKEIEDSGLSTEKLFDLSATIQISTYYGISWMKLLKDFCPSFIMCTLHFIHNGFQKELNACSHEAEELTFNLYY